MKLETINNIRVLTPSNGMWLYNSKDRVISDKVYLGVNADATQWVEITEEEKLLLEQQWESDTDEPSKFAEIVNEEGENAK